MKTTILCSIFAVCALAQEPQRIMIHTVQAGGSVGVGDMLGAAVKGSPYSATIVTESVQVLADGNRISQKNQGSVARDSQGRMRHEAILPVIGNMSAASALPKVVFINDPVAGVTYTLNPGDKTYRKMPTLAVAQEANQKMKVAGEKAAAGADKTVTFEMKVGNTVHVVAPPPNAGYEVRHTTGAITGEQMQYKSESLGTKVIDGVVAEGTRSTRTIPAGEIGNEKPIEIVSETWYSSELKTIVYSKRSDPRSGDLTYSLTNISRAEPDQSLFAVPADYKATAEAGAKSVVTYKAHED